MLRTIQSAQPITPLWQWLGLKQPAKSPYIHEIRTATEVRMLGNYSVNNVIVHYQSIPLLCQACGTIENLGPVFSEQVPKQTKRGVRQVEVFRLLCMPCYDKYDG